MPGLLVIDRGPWPLTLDQIASIVHAPQGAVCRERLSFPPNYLAAVSVYTARCCKNNLFLSVELGSRISALLRINSFTFLCTALLRASRS